MANEKSVLDKLSSVFLELKSARQAELEPDFDPRSGNIANEFAHFAGGGSIALALMALGSFADMKGITAPKGQEMQAAINGFLETSGVMCTGFLWMMQDAFSGRDSVIINSMKSGVNNPNPRQNKADIKRQRASRLSKN